MAMLWRWTSSLENNYNIIGFPADNNNSISLKFKQPITGQRGNGGTLFIKFDRAFWMIKLIST